MRVQYVFAAALALLTACGAPEPESETAPVEPAVEPAAVGSVPVEKEEVAMADAPEAEVSFRFITTNNIRMHIAEAGADGPLVLLAHGWPESWYSWRHQIPALVSAGFRVVVPEMRGYGQTDAPESVDDYDIEHLAADMVGVLDALGEEQAIMVGHDWGAVVAAYSVLLYPERFSSLVLMSVPYGGRSPQAPMESMKANFSDNFFYILYHNEPGGVAEAEYDGDPRGILSRLYLSPDSPREAPEVTDPKRAAGGWIPRLGAPKGLPDWLTQEDLDYYVAQFEASGFRGGVNYYRNIQRNWELTEHLAGARIEVPTLFIAGENDVVIGGATTDMLEQLMADSVADLRDVVLVPEVGHWVQQENAAATNEAMLEFLRGL